LIKIPYCESMISFMATFKQFSHGAPVYNCQVLDDDADSANAVLRKRLTCEDDPVLTREERLKIRTCLETLPGDDE